jgi:hypothetical protein
MKLTANQKRALRRLWEEDNLTIDDIASDLTFSTYEWSLDGEVAEVMEFDVPAVFKAAALLELGERPEIILPSPEDIRVACASIREQWTQKEREERLKHAWLSSLGTLRSTTGADNDARGGEATDRPAGDPPAPEARRRRGRG